MLRTAQLLTCLFLLLATSHASAQELDLDQAKTLVTFERFNLASNVVIAGDSMVIPDSQQDVLMVKELMAAPASPGNTVKIKVSTRPQFVLPLYKNLVALSDPTEDRLLIIDIAKGNVLKNYKFRNSFGPWQMAYHDGVIYGSNRFDRKIVRYDLDRGRELSAWNAGSGPTILKVMGDKLYVVEEGATGIPDDKLAIYNTKTGAVEKRVETEGAVNDMAIYGKKICLVASHIDLMRCGGPDLESWTDFPVAANPYRIEVAGNKVWTLSRGYSGSNDPVAVSLMIDDDNPANSGRVFELGESITNARAFDVNASNTGMVIRGDEKVIWVPIL